MQERIMMMTGDNYDERERKNNTTKKEIIKTTMTKEK